MKTVCHASIHEVDREEWNAIVPKDRMICSHEFLRAVEASGINHARFFYPVVHDNGKLVAHAAACLIDTELDAFATGPLKRLIRFVRWGWKDFFILHTLECGSPVGLGPAICMGPGAKGEAVLKEIVGCLEQVARREGVSTLFFRDFGPDDMMAIRPYFVLMGYEAAENLPEVRMPIRWTSFEAYLNDMRSGFRSNVRSSQRRFQRAGCVLREEFDYAPMADTLSRLWENAYHRAKEYRREILTPAFFRSMNRELGNRSSVLLAEQDGHCIGFLLLIRDDTVLTTLFSGLDYGANRETGCYFVLFHGAIERAIREKMRESDFGITTVSPKLDLGGEINPLYIWIKHVNPLCNRYVGRIFAWLTPQQTVGARRVFK